MPLRLCLDITNLVLALLYMFLFLVFLFVSLDLCVSVFHCSRGVLRSRVADGIDSVRAGATIFLIVMIVKKKKKC